jgi:hypothetical protein
MFGHPHNIGKLQADKTNVITLNQFIHPFKLLCGIGDSHAVAPVRADSSADKIINCQQSIINNWFTVYHGYAK